MKIFLKDLKKRITKEGWLNRNFTIDSKTELNKLLNTTLNSQARSVETDEIGRDETNLEDDDLVDEMPFANNYNRVSKKEENVVKERKVNVEPPEMSLRINRLNLAAAPPPQYFICKMCSK